MSKQNLFYYKKSISALDYFKVLEQAATRCVTEEAAKRLRELLPLFDGRLLISLAHRLFLLSSTPGGSFIIFRSIPLAL